MATPELTRLELLAEVDSLMRELERWSERGPDWPEARGCQALVRRLAERADTLRVRFAAPLVVATLGGTGTGKSSLTNALVGEEVTAAGHLRPTTHQPVLIARPDVLPEHLGIDARSVQIVHRDLPALRDVVLLDCPDPDTTEEQGEAGTNLARLRHLLPHCDVLLVTSTQQKYRSERVAGELAAAAPGARLLFVQTHADQDDDIRQDWRRLLAPEYDAREMFFIDSPAALYDAQQGREPRGDFGRLVDLLTRQVAGAAALRIRRANFLDLLEETVGECRRKIDAGLPAVKSLEMAIGEQRTRLALRLSSQMREELQNGRRSWENRLLAEVANQWGFSPFSLVLRLYQGLSGLLTAASSWRVRSPAQWALSGAMPSSFASRRNEEPAAGELLRPDVAWAWDAAELRTAGIIVEGYAIEADLPPTDAGPDRVAAQAEDAGRAFLATAAGDLQQALKRMAARHAGWFTRIRYEAALLLMLAAVLYRLGRNYFFDSWLAYDLGLVSQPAPVLGTDFLLQSLLWLTLWTGLLLWLFTSRLRRGLRTEVARVADGWTSTSAGSRFFRDLENECRMIERFRLELDRVAGEAAAVHARLLEPLPLGARVPRD